MVLVEAMVVANCVWSSLALLQLILLCSQGVLDIPRLRLTFAVWMPALVAYHAYRRRSLSFSGAIAACYIGLVISLWSWEHTVALLVFFYASSQWTKFRQKHKQAVDGDFKPGGQRNWKQVFANGGTATFLAAFAVVRNSNDLLISVRESTELSDSVRRSIWYDLAILGVFICAAGDTWASEIGSAVQVCQPRLITTFKRMPTGTNGAISLVGTLASVVGGASVGLAYAISSVLLGNKLRAFDNETSFVEILAVVTVIGGLFGLIGSIVDSVLGATVQYSGFDENSRTIVEHPGPNVKHLAGRYWLDNHDVNLVATLSTSLLTPLALYIFIS